MICIPIVEGNIRDALVSAERALEVADIVEFRVDYLREIKEEDIVEMAKYPSIITIRAHWEGGRYRGSYNRRIELYRLAIENSAKYIDIELSERKNIELVNFRDEIGGKTKIILSYHNFEETPSYTTLLDIVDKELRIGDIGKFATMVNTKRDILKILMAIQEFEGRVIGIGMGEKGKLTRILGTYFGSILTFASMNSKSSAPGQIDIEDLKNIYRILLKS
ncbi:MAG TPA: type I 3-dehydroquinate dehydratase [Methanothermococcus okinawensis]|uniref:3-dehydroquinate dehydratase n=1 Tax=Methanothermococcus okinawensis TaxID=155863 RepID=A0A832ZJU1_9EURY|nr:type I 3-dehydroquinate dehydratase [Methanococcaceae archaeon]HIP84539.1 type I 3-dehydroquinate dehydratase [Methanothermococcus okinawensis]HIP91787.1 type I 3-dehydroquinate dehydratase [Methanothermococcus okinawensis]